MKILFIISATILVALAYPMSEMKTWVIKIEPMGIWGIGLGILALAIYVHFAIEDEKENPRSPKFLT